MTGSQVTSLLKQAWNEFTEDRAMRLAAALACYTILSLAPLVVITMKISTWLLHDKAKEYLLRAMARLHGDRELALARAELQRIEPLIGGGPGGAPGTTPA